MEEENDKIYKILEQNNIGIGSCFGIETNLKIGKINQSKYQIKYSIFSVSNLYITFNGEKEEKYTLLEINVKLLLNFYKNDICKDLPYELNSPRFKYKIIMRETTFLFFENHSDQTLKDVIKERVEEQVYNEVNH